MPDFIPTELTQEMLDAGIEAITKMVPCASEVPKDTLADMVQNIWMAIAMAHGRRDREASIWGALKGGAPKH